MEIDVMIAEYEKRLKSVREQLGLLMRTEQQLIGALTALGQITREEAPASKKPADRDPPSTEPAPGDKADA